MLGVDGFGVEFGPCPEVLDLVDSGLVMGLSVEEATEVTPPVPEAGDFAEDEAMDVLGDSTFTSKGVTR